MILNEYQIRISTPSRNLVDISGFRIDPGHITFLFGESGIGKTLVCKTIYGLLDPAEFEIELNGVGYNEYLQSPDVARIRQDGFFVFQEPSSHLNPLLRVTDQLHEGDLPPSGIDPTIITQLWEGEDGNQLDPLLPVFPKPYRPSGGEKQRVLLTMAFQKCMSRSQIKNNDDSALFIFDEPTGSLDNRFRNRFLSLLFEKYHENPFTAVVITHDYSMISQIYGQHKETVSKIHLRELSLENNRQVIHTFEAGDYLDWLRNESRPVPEKSDAPGDRTALLTLDTGLKVFGRTLQFYKDQAPAVPVNLTIHGNEWVYLKAASGVGKTTIAKVILGLYPAENMRMSLGKKRISSKTPRQAWRKKLWGKKLCMVFQHADESLNRNSSVADVFAGLPLTGTERSAIKEELRDFFGEQFNPDFLKKKVRYLSGGQKQRLNLLRALVLDPDLLILDEPLNGLDFKSVVRIIRLLQSRRRAGKGLLIISHNEEIFDALIPKDRIFFLQAET